MVDFFGRACFGTRRGGWGERYAPNAAKPGAPAGVNALNPENPGYAGSANFLFIVRQSVTVRY